MAGSLAFYSGLMPGISRTVSSIADDTAYNKGYATQANAMHDLASARKADAEAEATAANTKNHAMGGVNYVMGQHGVTGKVLDDFQKDRYNGGTGNGAAFAMNPGVSPGETIPKLNLALRDLGAFQYGAEKAAPYMKAAAEQPGMQAESEAKRVGIENFNKSLAANPKMALNDIIQMSQAAVGKDVLADKTPAPLKTAQILSAMPQDQQKSLISIMQATHPPATQINMPGATHYGTDPATGKAGMFQIGKDGKQIFTPIDPPPPTNPVDAEIARKIKARNSGQGAQPPAPAVQSNGKKPTNSGW